MTELIDFGRLSVDGNQYHVTVTSHSINVMPCVHLDEYPPDGGWAYFPKEMVVIIPLNKATVNYAPVEWHQDEIRTLIRLHVLAFDPKRLKREDNSDGS